MESEGIVVLAILDAVLVSMFFLFRVLPWSEPGPWRLIWIIATLTAALFSLGEAAALMQRGTAVAFEVQGPLFGALLALTACFMLVYLHGSRIGEHALTLAFTDDLTQLPNSRAFTARLETSMQGSDPFSLAYVELEGLSALNDLYGAHRGDAFLQSFARILLDSAGHGGAVGRLGGVQFAMLIAPENAPGINERIASALHSLVVHEFGGIEMNAAVGIVPRSEASDPGRLIRLAYRAMRHSRIGPTGIRTAG
ncbi:MAG: GGDEF domain-containing protein [Chloroflexi bacterium]|nr:MAG: GGDEF domain-containing protein [Chloroflexota bacterium]